MNVPFWVWAATIVGLLAVLALDLAIVGRRPHEVGVREAARWVAVYIALAALFAVGLFVVAGQEPATAFVAGYVTEYSLSVDNLFVFLLIMGAFAVPKVHQHRVLLFGILIALVLRGGFILAGAAVIERFSWVFYLFGAFLVLTAIKVVMTNDEDEEFRENAALRLVRRVLPVTDDYVGTRSVVRRRDARGRLRLMVTPMLMVMIAIGMTDLLFALDSIPAIFGLTRDPYIVFTANMFALMGLRQLYFLLGGLLQKLVYLSYGLGVILAFIGVKLILEALHTNTLPFLGGGLPLDVPVIGIENLAGGHRRCVADHDRREPRQGPVLHDTRGRPAVGPAVRAGRRERTRHRRPHPRRLAPHQGATARAVRWHPRTGTERGESGRRWRDGRGRPRGVPCGDGPWWPWSVRSWWGSPRCWRRVRATRRPTRRSCATASRRPRASGGPATPRPARRSGCRASRRSPTSPRCSPA